MTNEFYKTAFESAVGELATLSKKRDSLLEKVGSCEDRMDKVRQGAIALASLANIDFQRIKDEYPELFEDQLDPRIGLTDAVRTVLKSSDTMLPPMEIRDRVFRVSPAIAGHKSPLASIHSVIRRLTDNFEAVMGVDGAGRTAYGWIGTDDAEDRIKAWITNPEDILAKYRKFKQRKKK